MHSFFPAQPHGTGHSDRFLAALCVPKPNPPKIIRLNGVHMPIPRPKRPSPNALLLLGALLVPTSAAAANLSLLNVSYDPHP